MICSAVTEDKERLHFSFVSVLPSPAPKPSEVGPDDAKKAEIDQKGDIPVEEDASRSNSTEDESKDKTDDTRPKVADPIRMFGILVPPALRSAQLSFREAVDGPVIRLAAVTGELRALERDIGRARKAVRKA